MSDPKLSEIIAATETSRLGPPTGVDAPRGCAPELFWRTHGVELVRATFYGRWAILGVAGDASCAGPIDLVYIAHALDEAADRLAVRGLETIAVSAG